jgi:hypothetical protein
VLPYELRARAGESYRHAMRAQYPGVASSFVTLALEDLAEAERRETEPLREWTVVEAVTAYSEYTLSARTVREAREVWLADRADLPFVDAGYGDDAQIIELKERSADAQP